MSYYKMKKQEVFDTVAVHLLKQGQPSRLDENTCSYRTPMVDAPPLSCAVGCLIRDEDYNPDMETVSVTGLLDRGKDLKLNKDLVKFIKRHEPLLSDLQVVHDSIECLSLDGATFVPEYLIERLKEVARDHRCNMKVFAEFNKGTV